MRILHKYITVNSDEQIEENFEGSLADFAAKKLSEWLSEKSGIKVINIECDTWTNTIQPRLDNSDTWYERTTKQLSVWLERI